MIDAESTKQKSCWNCVVYTCVDLHFCQAWLVQTIMDRAELLEMYLELKM